MNNKIDVFIPTYNRKDSAKTHLLFKDCLDKYKITYLFHTQEEAEAYKLPEWCIKHVSGVKTGITGCCLQKRYAHRIATSEYFCILDDDIGSFYGVNGAVGVSEVIEDTLAIMKKENCFMGGASPSANRFYLSDKYSLCGRLVGYFSIFKRGSLVEDPLSLCCINEDVSITCSYIIKYGKVVINKKYCSDYKMYQSGGIGSKKHREENGIIQEAILFVDKYYPIIRFSKKFGEVEFCNKREGFSELIEHDWVVAVKHLYGIK